ncbi:MAG: protein kinase domain-containing protein [Gammaproteobacteria bacterium]
MTADIAGNYRILEKLGEGGMGEVFKGLDLSLERYVAIKALRPELTQHPEVLERFRKEAVALARLNHPNIATLYSFVSHGQGYYMVMEFAPGKTLDRVIAEYGVGLPWNRVLLLFRQALQAIEHAHHQGIVHRDIKPTNMMLSDKETLKVLDFGIARVLDATRFTRTGLVVGTPKYMAPEQITGRQVDERSDIYSLGVVLYEMVAGHVPFKASSEFDLMRAQIEDAPPPLREASVPKAIEDAAMRALAKRPEERFQTVSEFMDALQEPLESSNRLSGTLSHSTADRRKAAEREPSATGSVTLFPGAWAAAASTVGATALNMHLEDDPSVVSLERARAQREGAQETPADAGTSDTEAGEGTAKIALARSHPLARLRDVLRSRNVVISLGVVAIAAASIIVYTTMFSSQPVEYTPERVPVLVKQGKRALADGKLTEPLDDNALAFAEQALDLSLENDEAKQLMEEVIALMVELGEASLAEGSMAQAKDYRDRVESLATKYGVSAGPAAALSKRVTAEETRLADMQRERVVRAQREQRVERLLEKARQELAAGRLTEPRKDNAMSHAREVLDLAPGHAEARDILAKVLQGSVARGEKAVGEGDLTRAKALRDTAHSLVEQYGLADDELALLEQTIAQREQKLAEHDARLNALIKQAEAARAADRWTAPEGDSVLEYARQILDLDPEHEGARQLISQTVGKSLEAAGSALNRGELEKARAYSEAAGELVRRYQVESAELNWLSERIAAEERRRQEAEQQQAQRKTRIEQLLGRAREALAAGRWVDPPEDNALAHTRNVLALEPGNTDVREVLAGILHANVAQAEQALSKGDLSQAKALHESAASLVNEYALADDNLPRLVQGIAGEERKLAAQAARGERIEELMDRARKARAADRWTAPAEDNVLAYANQVLGLLPQHQGARELVAQTVARTLELAQAAFDRGELDQAESLSEQAQEIARQYGVAGADKKGLAQRIAAEEQRRQQMEQKQVERATRFEELTRRANQALAVNNLTTPKRDNVVAYARELIALVPQDAQTQRLLGVVIERYVEMAAKALARNDIQPAHAAQQKARDVAAEFGIANNDLERLGERIAAKEMDLAEGERKREEARRLAEAKAAEGQEKKAVRVDDIDGLLEQATKALAANRLTTPAGANAAEYAGRVLTLQAGHPGAMRILQEAVGRYVALGEVALSTGRVDNARRYQRTAEKLVKGYRLPDAELRKLAARVLAKRREKPVAKRRPAEPARERTAAAKPAQESRARTLPAKPPEVPLPTASAKPKAASTPLAGDPPQDQELEQLRQQLELLRRKSEEPPRPSPREETKEIIRVLPSP